MIPALRSEFRKMLTVRSTYFLVGFSFLLVVLFAGYADGFRDGNHGLIMPTVLRDESYHAVLFSGLLLSFVGLLLMGNEYRYNTIMYTLTNTNRRLKVLGTKFIAISVFAVVVGLAASLFSPLCAILGAHLHHHHIVPQHFVWWTVIWRCAFVAWGYAMYAFVIISIMRNQVGSIVAFLLIPLLGENLITHIFPHTTNYMPFMMLQAVPNPAGFGNHTSLGHAVTVSLTYIVVGLVVSSILFLKRDAN